MNGLIERTTTGDVHTIGASYALMVLYIVIALGRVSSWKKFFIEGKLSLSLTGVVLVLFSVGASIGMFGFFQVPATLIIFEILPFLVLAVGVDNIFIMVDAHQKMPKLENEPDISHIGRVVGEVAPSMFVSTAAQVSPISYFTKLIQCEMIGTDKNGFSCFESSKYDLIAPRSDLKKSVCTKASIKGPKFVHFGIFLPFLTLFL